MPTIFRNRKCRRVMHQQRPSVQWMWPARRTKNGEIRNLWTRKTKAKISMTNSIWIQDFFPGGSVKLQTLCWNIRQCYGGINSHGHQSSIIIFFPPTLDHIRKEETATLPDGTTYQLRSIQYRISTTTRCRYGKERAITLHFWPKFVVKTELYFYYLVVSDYALVHCGNCESISFSS